MQYNHLSSNSDPLYGWPPHGGFTCSPQSKAYHCHLEQKQVWALNQRRTPISEKDGHCRENTENPIRCGKPEIHHRMRPNKREQKLLLPQQQNHYQSSHIYMQYHLRVSQITSTKKNHSLHEASPPDDYDTRGVLDLPTQRARGLETVTEAGGRVLAENLPGGSGAARRRRDRVAPTRKPCGDQVSGGDEGARERPGGGGGGEDALSPWHWGKVGVGSVMCGWALGLIFSSDDSAHRPDFLLWKNY